MHTSFLIAYDAYLARFSTPSPAGGGRGWGPAAVAPSACAPTASQPPSQPSPRGGRSKIRRVTRRLRAVKRCVHTQAREGRGEPGQQCCPERSATQPLPVSTLVWPSKRKINAMPLHDCPYSFQELAADVLPELMASLRERMEQPCKASNVQGSASSIPDARGAYVWLVAGKPVYVGIANRLRRRIKDHLSPDPSRANLAVRMAAQQLGVPVSTVKRQPGFAQAFVQAQSTLAQAHLAFIEIPNSLVLYLFEPYCAMALDTGDFNRFDTLQILSPRPNHRIPSP